jgi:hypothetical protein
MSILKDKYIQNGVVQDTLVVRGNLVAPLGFFKILHTFDDLLVGGKLVVSGDVDINGILFADNSIFNLFELFAENIHLTGGLLGPMVTTQDAAVRFSTTTGSQIANSLMVIDDAGNVGVPTSLPRLTSDAFTMNTAPVAGYVLTSDALGVASWQSFLPGTGLSVAGGVAGNKVVLWDAAPETVKASTICLDNGNVDGTSLYLGGGGSAPLGTIQNVTVGTNAGPGHNARFNTVAGYNAGGGIGAANNNTVFGANAAIMGLAGPTVVIGSNTTLLAATGDIVLDGNAPVQRLFVPNIQNGVPALPNLVYTASGEIGIQPVAAGAPISGTFGTPDTIVVFNGASVVRPSDQTTPANSMQAFSDSSSPDNMLINANQAAPSLGTGGNTGYGLDQWTGAFTGVNCTSFGNRALRSTTAGLDTTVLGSTYSTTSTIASSTCVLGALTYVATTNPIGSGVIIGSSAAVTADGFGSVYAGFQAQENSGSGNGGTLNSVQIGGRSNSTSRGAGVGWRLNLGVGASGDDHSNNTSLGYRVFGTNSVNEFQWFNVSIGYAVYGSVDGNNSTPFSVNQECVLVGTGINTAGNWEPWVPGRNTNPRGAQRAVIIGVGNNGGLNTKTPAGTDIFTLGRNIICSGTTETVVIGAFAQTKTLESGAPVGDLSIGSNSWIIGSAAPRPDISIGYFSGANLSAPDVICVGAYAGGHNQAVYDQSVLVGSNCAAQDTSGAAAALSDCVFVGAECCADMTTSTTTTSNSVYVGYDTGIGALGTSDTATDRIALGSGAKAAVTNQIVLDGGGVSNALHVPSLVTNGVLGANIELDGDQLGIAVSSRRFKKDIEDLDDFTERVLRLQPKNYKYKDAGPRDHRRWFGLIAEEVEQHVPEMCVYNKENVLESVNYSLLNVLLIQAIKSFNQRVETLHQTLLTMS